MTSFAPTPVASRLTGLSTETLREWTSRRALIPADVRPRKKGSPAQYSWQTVLVLRLAVALRNQFHVELQAHKALFDGLRVTLYQHSFIGLWGKSLAISAGGAWALVDQADAVRPDDAILIRLDPHLDIISAGFMLPDPRAVPGQFDLFPVLIATRRDPDLKSPPEAAPSAVARARRNVR